VDSASEVIKVALKDNPTVAEDVIREAVLGEAALREAVREEAALREAVREEAALQEAGRPETTYAETETLLKVDFNFQSIRNLKNLLDI
jgi:hypothetical protein